MALKTYGKETLNDNWFEERSPPLNGILIDNCERSFSTSNKIDFQNHTAIAKNCGIDNAKLQKKFSNGKRSNKMITLTNFDQSQRLRNLSEQPSIGFGSVLPTPLETPSTEQVTSYQEKFGKGVKTSYTEKRRIKEGAVRPSGGGGLKPDRGFSTSGACGEVYKEDLDPQRSTQCQRTWMYSLDPMIAVKKKNLENLDYKISTQLKETNVEETTNNPSFARQTTSITATPKHKNVIFADD